MPAGSSAAILGRTSTTFGSNRSYSRGRCQHSTEASRRTTIWPGRIARFVAFSRGPQLHPAFKLGVSGLSGDGGRFDAI